MWKPRAKATWLLSNGSRIEPKPAFFLLHYDYISKRHSQLEVNIVLCLIKTQLKKKKNSALANLFIHSFKILIECLLYSRPHASRLQGDANLGISHQEPLLYFCPWCSNKVTDIKLQCQHEPLSCSLLPHPKAPSTLILPHTPSCIPANDSFECRVLYI